MNTQSTPVHIRLWNRDFWHLAIANLLLTMSVTMMIPTLPVWLMGEENLSNQETGILMGVFGVGIFLLGAFCSFLVQRYRRNQVCMLSILAIIGCQAFLYYGDTLKSEFVDFSLVLIQRILLGAFFGLSVMVLESTLVIDSCEASQRTEANHSAAWFARFALALGPLGGVYLMQMLGFSSVLIGSMVCAGAALLLIRLVNFPFRTPEEHLHAVCLDRFFLSNGSLLFINMIMISIVIGLVMSMITTPLFYMMMMVGFLLAIVAQHFVFRDAELKSEVVTGLILIGAALLLMLTRTQQVVSYLSPAFIGLGIGIVGSRFLLFFIKLSRHCQRGTSQSTYLLGWESGLSIGIGIGYGLFYQQDALLLIVALVITAVSLAMYHLLTHQWFIANKNR